jgi:1-aminocyclopropane-1-carboxylate deaminase/D-cysteine desulfhydrase-like pyridoxal-dependent ACC family enzyme
LCADFDINSIGGPQSNSMLAIAKIVAHHKDSCFYYITKRIPKFLKNKPSGNYEAAITLGMKVIVCQ